MANSQPEIPEILESLEPLFTDMVLKWANYLHEKNTLAASRYLKRNIFDNYFTDIYMITRSPLNIVDKYTKYYKLTENLILDLKWYVQYRNKGRGLNPVLYDLNIKVTAEDIKMFETYFKIISNTIKSDINEHAAYLKTRADEHARVSALKRTLAKKITLVHKSMTATELIIEELTKQKHKLISSSKPKTPRQFTLNLNDSNYTTNSKTIEIAEIDRKLGEYNSRLDIYKRELSMLQLDSEKLIASYPSHKMNIGNNDNNDGRRRSRSRTRSGSGSLRNIPLLFEGGTRKKKRTPK